MSAIPATVNGNEQRLCDILVILTGPQPWPSRLKLPLRWAAFQRVARRYDDLARSKDSAVSCRDLSRHQPKPSPDVAAFREGISSADRRYHRARDDRSDAGHAH
jgi:hypothetical protein